MIQSVARITSTNFADNAGRVLFEAAADSEGAYRDERDGICVAVLIAATGGGARCVLTAGRGGEGGGFTIRREFDVVPQYDALLMLNYRTMKVQVERLFDTTTVVCYGVLYHWPVRLPRLRRYESYAAADGIQAAPEGAREFTPDVADTWTWAVQAAGGFNMTQVLGGDADVAYPVLGQQFTPTVDTRVIWTLEQP